MALFALGSNGSGQLGIGHKEDVSVPKPVLFNDDFSEEGAPQVRAGGNHTLLLFSTGHLYWSGDPNTGACGPSRHIERPIASFKPVVFDNENPWSSQAQDIVLFVATWEASVMAQKDEDGRATKVYSFGLGNKGELGQGELIFRATLPSLIKDFPPAGTEVVDLAASVTHVVAVLDNGEVYGWGNGRKGQLGQPRAVPHLPRKFEDIGFKVVRAVCGREFTCLIGDAASGNLKILGSDKWGIQSGAPPDVKGWKDMGSGWGNIYVLKSDGQFISWGRNDHGQLGPKSLPLLSMIAAGSEHVVALSHEGDVIAWGWGEHGNCGPATDGGDVKDKFGVIAASKYLDMAKLKVQAIGAGCATSWISTQSEA